MDSMVGKKYGQLTVLKHYFSDKYKGSRRDFCLCLCDCGNTKEINGKNIRRGMTTSCGCFHTKRIFEVCHKVNKYMFDNKNFIVGIDSKGGEFLFSHDKFELVKDHCWNVGGNGYAATNIGGKPVFMHNLIMGTDEKRTVDHINRKRNDNRNENLRFTTIQLNNCNRETSVSRNTSGIMGVSRRSEKMWHSYLMIDGKRINLYSKTFEEAVKKRLSLEKEYPGEFAPQKHLFEKYGVV